MIKYLPNVIVDNTRLRRMLIGFAEICDGLLSIVCLGNRPINLAFRVLTSLEIESIKRQIDKKEKL
jgi:hypothetical protein